MSANKNFRELSWLSNILGAKCDKKYLIQKKNLPWPVPVTSAKSGT